jgi:hypothetical protein
MIRQAGEQAFARGVKEVALQSFLNIYIISAKSNKVQFRVNKFNRRQK